MDLKKILGNIEGHDELIEKINAEIGREFVPRAEFNAKNDELKSASQALAERDKQLEQLSGLEGDRNALKAEINRLKSENKEAAEKYADEMKKIRINQAIEREISGIANPDALDIIPGLIKTDSIILNEDGSILGLKEQVQALKESRKSLFKTDGEKIPQFVRGQTAQTEQAGLTREQIEAIKDPVERRRKIAENINLYK